MQTLISDGKVVWEYPKHQVPIITTLRFVFKLYLHRVEKPGFKICSVFMLKSEDAINYHN